MIGTLLAKLESSKPFTDKEAWNLFRLAAISEAIGWTLLISGILIQHFITPHSTIPVLIAGQIHGTIFLIYIVAVVVLYTSLRWSRKRTIIAGLASIPPYGTLIFEQWAAHKRRNEALKTFRAVTVRAIIIQNNSFLAIQSNDSTAWQLPGGLVEANETVEEALVRHVMAQTNTLPSIAQLAYVLQYKQKHTQQLELFFVVANPKDFKEKLLRISFQEMPSIDEIAYLIPKNNLDLEPAFLRTESVITHLKQKDIPVQFIVG